MTSTRTDREAKSNALALGLLLTVFMSVCLLLAAKPAHAEAFTVNSTDDIGDQNLGNSFCDTEPFQVGTQPKCTLRAAI